MIRIISYTIPVQLVLLIHILMPGCVIAQEKPPAVLFNGSNVLLGQFSSRQGTNSEVPENYFRNDLKMDVTVSDIPLSTRFFITTERSDYTQRIDNMSFYIDLVTLKRNRARIDAQYKANKLPDKKAPWMLRFLSNFSKIEAGRFRPAYGDLMLDGISVSGLNLELSNKIVYAAFATGRIKKAARTSNPLDTTYKQKLMFGKFGFGEKNRTHFYLAYMRIEDGATGLWQGYESDISSTKPRSNDIFGSEFKLSLLKNKWTIDGDAGVSLFTRDTRIPITYDSITSDYNAVDDPLEMLPDPIIDFLEPNISTSYDWAYGARTKLSLRTTTISGGYRYVGPGYITLGNTNLVNDRQTIDGRIDHALLKRKITFSAFYKQFKDNLIDWKEGTTTSTTLGISARFTFTKAPYFQFSYTPNRQETNGDSLFIRNKMNVFSASSGYSYPLGGLKSFTTLAYFNQSADFESDRYSKVNKSQTFTLNQVFTLNIPLKLNFSAAFSDINQTGANKNVTSLVISATHQSFENRWKNTAGGKYKKDNSGKNQKKISLFWDMSFQLWDKGDIGWSLEENVFRDGSDPANDYNEFIAQCKLSINW